ncbi:MAG: urease accessory protein UreF [Myxococcota bacterium]|nr:urease accessory protein UreF [Myxococcota bacterium]
MNAALGAEPLLRLLQLASQSLPVGAYAYSQGLESAVEAGWVKDETSLSNWLEEQLSHSIGRVDLPVFARFYDAARREDTPAYLAWSQRLIAMRETSELVADDCDRGRALARLLHDLGIDEATPWLPPRDAPFAALAALAAVRWDIPLEAALQAHAWGWLENQVLVGVKLIPLGQVAGQRLLLGLSQKIPEVCDRALELGDDEIGGMLPIAALASSLHETQYSRLFRS